MSPHLAPIKPKSPPIHKLDSGFELHGLPELPTRGVVGLLGGFGKTTALMIFAGKLDPSCGWNALVNRYCTNSSQASSARYNMNSRFSAEHGGYDKNSPHSKSGRVNNNMNSPLSKSTQADYNTNSPLLQDARANNNISFLRFAQARYNILRKIDADELVTSYKPQAVERLRHLSDFRLGLSDLKLDFDVVNELRLAGYDNKNIDKLKASELQRVSVAACLSKDAEVYLLDCPTDYLDIVYRIRIAKMIREKGKKALVIVADNDMTFLRLACDYISIFYGSDTWSVSSQLYSSKQGIDSFVRGSLPAEQVLIREQRNPGESVEQRAKRLTSVPKQLIEFSGLQKHFGESVMQADGHINDNERVCLLGEDETGKSALLEIISGKDKEFSGLLRGKYKVSFKPEHLPQSAVLKGLPKTMLRILGIPLRGHPKLTQSLRQRIAIARCLNAEADVYALDQPTDGLTTEERFALVELLKTKRCLIIADHDAWLAARVCDKCGFVVRTNGRSYVEWMDVERAIERLMG